MALDTNPRLKAEALNRNIADSEIEARKAAYYPRLELVGQGKYRYNDDGLPGERTDFFVGLGVTYNLYRGGGDKAAVEAAVSSRQSFAQLYEEEIQLVLEEVRNSWQVLETAEAKQKTNKHNFVRHPANGKPVHKPPTDILRFLQAALFQ